MDDDGVAVFLIHYNGQYEEHAGNEAYVGGERRIVRICYSCGFDEFISTLHTRIGTSPNEAILGVRCLAPMGRFMSSITTEIRDDEDLKGIIELFKNASISMGIIYVTKLNPVHPFHRPTSSLRKAATISNDAGGSHHTPRRNKEFENVSSSPKVKLNTIHQRTGPHADEGEDEINPTTNRNTPDHSEYVSYSHATPLHYYRTFDESVDAAKYHPNVIYQLCDTQCDTTLPGSPSSLGDKMEGTCPAQSDECKPVFTSPNVSDAESSDKYSTSQDDGSDEDDDSSNDGFTYDVFGYADSFNDGILRAGQTYSSKDEFLEAVRDHSIRQNFEFRTKYSTPSKVGVTCVAKGCQWGCADGH